MRKKTYRVLIILAVVVVSGSLALAIGISYHNHRTSTVGTTISETQQSRNNEQLSQLEDHVSEKEQQAVPVDSSFEIHFFDVGEADAALVECDGHYMLIDGGNPSNSRFLYAYLQKNGIDYLDYIVCSHAHTDHVGGLAGALNYAKVGVAYAPVTEYDSRAFDSFVKYLNKQGKQIVVPSPGDTIMLGVAKIAFIGPVDMSLAEENHNNASIILRIEYGSTSILFTGDAETEEESSVISAGVDLKSNLLKVSHHGSYTSSSEAFLSSADPDYAVISVGTNNEYGHPHDVTLDRLSRYCKAIYRTDLMGEVICYSDGTSLTIEVDS